ncbi:O-antigen polymerase [Dyella sedimenti]|uniref:O-antigen polymerase n=1 Tax=Dyella sedimenti TaxID=2919947 RepID=UPI001FA9FCC4|nr:O-antigen polymerase [Dyella sedimenti]
MIFASLVFLLLNLLLLFIERKRTRRTGADLLSVFFLIFSLQNTIPGVVIPLLIERRSGIPNTDNIFFNRIYQYISPEYICLSAILCFLFVGSVYFAYFSFRGRSGDQKTSGHARSVQVVPWRLAAAMLVGAISSALLLREMDGGSLIGAYQTLAAYRTGGGVARTFMNANLFALTTTFSVLSIIPVLYAAGRPKSKKRTLGLVLAFVAMIGFSLMTVSRRSLPLNILLIYFALVIVNKRWYLKSIALMFLFFMPVLIYGKTVLYSISINRDMADTLKAIQATDARGAILTGFSYLGISLDSSWATFLFLDLPPRLGIDHWLSVMRRIPLGTLGFDKESVLPERIVRISTRAFVGADAEDIPPGLIGQMWMDFRLLGPIVWGLGFGVLMRLLQRRFEGRQKTLEAAGYLIVVIYVATLPLNTGSFDFVFSIDNLFIFGLLWLVYRKTRARVSEM